MASKKAEEKVVKLTSEQNDKLQIIEKEFFGLIPCSHIDFDYINKGDTVRAVYGAGLITHPSFFVIFAARIIEGKVVKKTTKKLKQGKTTAVVNSFSVLWNYDKTRDKKLTMRTSNIVHDKGGLVANQIYMVKSNVNN